MNQLSLFDAVARKPAALSDSPVAAAAPPVPSEQPSPATPARRRRGGMRLERRADGWWIVNIPDNSNPENGPYDRKAEAEDGRQGLTRFFTDHPEYADE